MALDTYRKKRQFAVTPEPRGGRVRRGDNARHYVIQKHAARRLHYDLRLELDGVMKSWAVTRGPSLDPNEKRLAVHVEDHPIEYNSFEGIIPEGEYGGGTVMIWDRGRWMPEGDPHKAYAKGHLVFDLDGKKLHGRWHLVRMRARDNDRHDNWLLIKGKDEEARGPRGKDVLEEKPRSVATGRSMEEIATGKGGRKRVWHSNRSGDAAAAEEKLRGNEKRAAMAKTGSAKPAIRAAAKPTTSEATAPKVKRRAASADAPAAVLRRRGTRAAGAERERHGVPLPDFVPFSLATLYDQAPSGADWLHEIKFDGYRMEARLDRGTVQLLTRHRQDWTHRFRPLAEAVAALPATTALLDGEIVVEDDKGISNFSLLQTDLKDGRLNRFVYYFFDLLHLDGRDLTGRPLLERKAALAGLVKSRQATGPLRYAEHFDESGPVIYRHACEMGLEGIVSRRRNAPYRPGRSDNFIKTKCRARQEFVVAGYSPSTALPNAVGALTVAVNENGELRYAGRIGTGYTRKTARDLWMRLEALRTDRRPIALPADERRKNVIWVRPELVVEAKFAGVTHGGILRQASFQGVREDKTAQEVVREVPAAKSAGKQRETQDKPKESSLRAGAGAPARGPAKKAANAAPQEFGRPAARDNAAATGTFQLTHPDRVYWPDVGVTKRDLVQYYAGVWEWLKPHVIGRSLALVRCPDGTSGECFFQKHIASNVKSSPLRRVVPGKDHDVIAVESFDDLIALVQSGALEIHVRGSRLDSLETCDRLVFDLDPGEGVSWREMVAAARETRERLRAEKLESFIKLSGGKGVHVVVPIADADWDTAKLFAQGIAASMSADSPQLYLAKMTKSLRKGRIFIDYFRNSREATSVAAYSTRARPGAPVSAPVSWERLGRTTAGNEFTTANLLQHLRNDPWADIGKVRQKLPASKKQ